MKHLLRSFLINFVALATATKYIEGLTYSGGIKTLLIGSVALMLINLAVIPLLKIMFLPLNLLTLGLFTWVVNVIGLYFLTVVIPAFKILPFVFPGASIDGFVIPSVSLNILEVAILASFLVGLVSHLLSWLCDK